MTDDFSGFHKRMELANERAFQEVERISSYTYNVAKKSRHKKRIAAAIEKFDEFDGMKNCVPRTKDACGSVFCFECRKRKQDGLYKQYKDYVENTFGGSESKARKRLRYVTILHSLEPINHLNLFQEDETIDRLVKARDDFRKCLLRLDRSIKESRFKKEIWLLGTIHIEMLNMDFYRFSALSGKQTTKQKTLTEFEEKSRWSSDYYFLFHSHCLIDGAGLTDRQLNQCLREIWNITDKQILMTPLTEFYEDGKAHTLDEALRNIANYGFNGSNGDLTFKTAWGNSRKVYTSVEKKDALGKVRYYVSSVKDTGVATDERLTLGQIRLLIKAHNAFTDGSRKGLTVTIR
jgi:hypothetical protein